MRIGVFSDTHGILDLADKALGKLGDIDLLLHAGDFYRDAAILGTKAGVTVHAVSGNCDWRSQEPVEKTIQAGGKKIYLTHGHQYQVKMSLQGLLYKGLEDKVDIVVFGHTHMAEYHWQDGLLLFNPGSLSYPRAGDNPSFGLLEIKDEEVLPTLYYL